jgi:hypothetical protein
MLQKLCLLSLVIMAIVIPVFASRDKSRTQGFKKTLKWTAAYCVFYLFALIYIYPRLE